MIIQEKGESKKEKVREKKVLQACEAKPYFEQSRPQSRERKEKGESKKEKGESKKLLRITNKYRLVKDQFK